MRSCGKLSVKATTHGTISSTDKTGFQGGWLSILPARPAWAALVTGHAGVQLLIERHRCLPAQQPACPLCPPPAWGPVLVWEVPLLGAAALGTPLPRAHHVVTPGVLRPKYHLSEAPVFA